jgi:hypothetical protein
MATAIVASQLAVLLPVPRAAMSVCAEPDSEVTVVGVRVIFALLVSPLGV